MTEGIALSLQTEADTIKLGTALAGILKPGQVIYLHGPLGAGKTTLVRGLIRALGHEGPVRSPTYTIMEPYEIDGLNLIHLDLYRLSDPEELEYLGLRDWAGEAVMLVEWPEKGLGVLANADVELFLDYENVGRACRIEGLLRRDADRFEEEFGAK